jgi:hypothetical protein
VTRTLRVAVPVVIVCIVGLVLRSSTGDYTTDAGPAIAALIAGHVHRALELQPLMGSFSLLVRAPFAWLAHAAGAGEQGIYRAGVVPCLAAAAALGVGLARLGGGERGEALLIPVLAVLTPASLAAVKDGHPEELLTSALCVGAVLLAMSGRPALAGLALGLALASKQWAVLAVLPVLLAAGPGRRIRLATAAVATALVLTLPLVLGNGHAFGATTHNAATAQRVATRSTVWFLVATRDRIRLHLPPGMPSSLAVYEVPYWTARVSHPLIVLLAVPLSLAVWLRRPSRYGEALALLTLLFLLRCVLDPADNEYYHAPLLISLLAWEALAGRMWRGIPIVTLAAIACVWGTFDLLEPRVAPALTNAVYLSWTAVLALFLLAVLGLLPGLGAGGFRSGNSSSRLVG